MRPLAALVLLAVIAAGCATPTTPTPGPSAPEAAIAYALDCSIARPDATWTEPCVALASANPSPSKTEIDVAVSPTDPDTVIVGSKDNDRAASSCVWAVPQVSHDGGHTWKTVYIGGKLADRKPGEPLWGWGCITDPIMAFDAKGVLYYTMQVDSFGRGYGPDALLGAGQPYVGNQIALARSKDGGVSWDKIVTLHGGDANAVYQDYMRMAASPKTGSVFTVWSQFTAGGVAGAVPVLAGTRDGGETATAPVYLTGPDTGIGAVARGIAAASDGTMYVLLHDGAHAWLTTSTDDGASWSAPAKAFPTASFQKLSNAKYRAGTFPELAVDATGGARDGTLYGAWADASGPDVDIVVSRSEDKGKTWSAPVKVNAQRSGDQWMPRVTITSDGVLHVAYMTRAYDAANTLVDAEWAYSTDGGASWSATRLTQTSFNGDVGVHQDEFPFLGDYIGIASSGTTVYAGFPTCLTGVCEIGVAKMRPAP